MEAKKVKGQPDPPSTGSTMTAGPKTSEAVNVMFGKQTVACLPKSGWLPLDVCPHNHCAESSELCSKAACAKKLQHHLEQLKTEARACWKEKYSLDEQVWGAPVFCRAYSDEYEDTLISIDYRNSSLCQNRGFDITENDSIDPECIACAVEHEAMMLEGLKKGLRHYRVWLPQIRGATERAGSHEASMKRQPSQTTLSAEKSKRGKSRKKWTKVEVQQLTEIEQGQIKGAAETKYAVQKHDPNEQDIADIYEDGEDDEIYGFGEVGFDANLDEDSNAVFNKHSEDSKKTLPSMLRFLQSRSRFRDTPPPVNARHLPLVTARTSIASTAPPPAESRSSFERERDWLREQVATDSPYGRVGSYRGHGAGALKLKGERVNSNANRAASGSTGGVKSKTGKKEKKPMLGR